MTIGYGESTFPSIVEFAAGWLIAAYQVGYGLAAFGAGALQRVVSLPSIFRIAAMAMVVMALLALLVARQQRPSSELSVSPATDFVRSTTTQGLRVRRARRCRCRRSGRGGSGRCGCGRPAGLLSCARNT